MDQLARFNQQLAAALIEAVEAKDPYTRGHSERVHHISMEIGRAMGLPADDLEDLHWGSLLHDVGKIGIPDAVLCKPGRLDRDEYAFIMVHPERSYEILRHVDYLKGAVLAARHHQEMYDGRGYPHGLKGARIPLLARIVAVADTYDSITSSRAYRAGRSHEIAMREIQRVSGTQLDPEVIGVAHQDLRRRAGMAQALLDQPRSEAGAGGRAAPGARRIEAAARPGVSDAVLCSRVGTTTVVAPVQCAARRRSARRAGGRVRVLLRRQPDAADRRSRPGRRRQRARARDHARRRGQVRHARRPAKILNPNQLVREIIAATGLGERLAMVDPAGRAKAVNPLQARNTRRRLGEILVERGLLTEAQLAQVAKLQQESGKRLGRLLIEQKAVTEPELLDALAEQLDVPLVTLRPGLYDAAAGALLTREVARRLEVLPLFKVHDTLTVATADPQDVPAIDEIRKISGCKVRIVLSRREDILKCQFDSYSGGDYEGAVHAAMAPDLELIEDQIPDDYTTIDQMAGASPVINLVNSLTRRPSATRRATSTSSPTRSGTRIRYRIDGVLHDLMSRRRACTRRSSRASRSWRSMDIAERRMPQDGRDPASSPRAARSTCASARCPAPRREARAAHPRQGEPVVRTRQARLRRRRRSSRFKRAARPSRTG